MFTGRVISTVSFLHRSETIDGTHMVNNMTINVHLVRGSSFVVVIIVVYYKANIKSHGCGKFTSMVTTRRPTE